MNIITIGIDLAKNIFVLHGVNENGYAALYKPKVSRNQQLPLIANLPPCAIGLEASSGARLCWCSICSVSPVRRGFVG